MTAQTTLLVMPTGTPRKYPTLQEQESITVWALRIATDRDRLCGIKKSALAGWARFGWSYETAHNLKKLAEDTEHPDYDRIYKKNKFLLSIRPDDWVVLINTPSYGMCMAAPVTRIRPDDDAVYEFGCGNELGGDFRSKIRIDSKRIQEFNRRDGHVRPYTQRNLSPRGRFQRVYFKREFFESLEDVAKDGTPVAPTERIRQDLNSGNGLLAQITAKIQHEHPGKELEPLIEQAFRELPWVHHVERKSGASDVGADLVVHFTSNGLGGFLAGIGSSTQQLLVQIKSHVGEDDQTKAMTQLKDAFEDARHQDAHVGIVFTTGIASHALRVKLENWNLEEEFGVHETLGPRFVHLIDGPNVARFFLGNAPQLI